MTSQVSAIKLHYIIKFLTSTKNFVIVKDAIKFTVQTRSDNLLLRENIFVKIFCQNLTNQLVMFRISPEFKFGVIKGEALRFLANSARPLVCESLLKTHLAYFLQSSISPRKSTLISLLNKPYWTQQQWSTLCNLTTKVAIYLAGQNL